MYSFPRKTSEDTAPAYLALVFKTICESNAGAVTTRSPSVLFRGEAAYPSSGIIKISAENRVTRAFAMVVLFRWVVRNKRYGESKDS